MLCARLAAIITSCGLLAAAALWPPTFVRAADVPLIVSVKFDDTNSCEGPEEPGFFLPAGPGMCLPLNFPGVGRGVMHYTYDPYTTQIARTVLNGTSVEACNSEGASPRGGPAFVARVGECTPDDEDSINVTAVWGGVCSDEPAGERLAWTPIVYVYYNHTGLSRQPCSADTPFVVPRAVDTSPRGPNGTVGGTGTCHSLESAPSVGNTTELGPADSFPAGTLSATAVCHNTTHLEYTAYGQRGCAGDPLGTARVAREDRCQLLDAGDHHTIAVRLECDTRLFCDPRAVPRPFEGTGSVIDPIGSDNDGDGSNDGADDTSAGASAPTPAPLGWLGAAWLVAGTLARVG